MTNDLSFLHNSWFWPVIALAVLVWGLFLWKELSQRNKPRFWLRAIASLLAVISLACIALRPQLKTDRVANSVILLTEGYQQAQLDSFSKLYRGIETQNYREGEPFIDPQNRPESVYILGQGVRDFDLWQLDSIKTSYLGGADISGVARIQYDPKSTQGSRMRFAGEYRNAEQGYQLVLLNAAGESVDSVTIGNEDIEKFDLFGSANTIGPQNFQLVEKDSLGEILGSNPLPMVIEANRFFDVLLVNDFPTFENKYLKNFLSESGHGVVTRTGLTRGRFKYEYFNLNSRPRVQFSQDALRNFDLLIIDLASLRKLSAAGRGALEQAIREDGLGVFILPEPALYTARLPITGFPFERSRKRESAIDGIATTNVAHYGYSFGSKFSMEPIHSSNGEVLSAYQRLGAGKLGTSVLENSYQMVLDGKQGVYRRLWTDIVESLGKEEVSETMWSSNGLWAHVDEPFVFEVRSRKFEAQSSKLEVRSGDGVGISLKQDYDVPTLWTGTVYPKNMGWKRQEVVGDSSSVFHYFVVDSAAWPSVMAYSTQQQNLRHFDSSDTIETQRSSTPVPVNLLWFFVPFVLSMGYLWLEGKV